VRTEPTRNEVFAEAMRWVLGDLSLRQVAARTGFSYGTIKRWRDGYAPGSENLQEFCARMEVDSAQRARLFRAAGLPLPAEDHADEPFRLLPGTPDVGYFAISEELTPGEIAVVNQTIRTLLEAIQANRGR
jgi:hypothetical protein